MFILFDLNELKKQIKNCINFFEKIKIYIKEICAYN